MEDLAYVFFDSLERWYIAAFAVQNEDRLLCFGGFGCKNHPDQERCGAHKDAQLPTPIR